MEEIKLSALPKLSAIPDTAIIYIVSDGVSYHGTKADLLAGLQADIETDQSLFYDTTSKQLRGNVSQVTNNFNWTTGPKVFELVDEPDQVIGVFANGVLLDNPLLDYRVTGPTKEITILKELPTPSRISINYQFIITK